MAAPALSDMVEGLVIRGPSKQPEPGCAESWTVSPDRLTWTFQLRAGLQWSDGRPLTADDFVYSYRRLLDPATGASNAGLFLALRNARKIVQRQLPPDALGVRAPDARTFVVELEFPVPYLLQLLANTQAAPGTEARHRHAGPRLGATRVTGEQRAVHPCRARPAEFRQADEKSPLPRRGPGEDRRGVLASHAGSRCRLSPLPRRRV